MKKHLILAALLLPMAGFAQLDLPAPSPAASVSQTVGLTDFKIEYSSPAVSGRKIWGELVPYGQLWRTGANRSTKVTFSKPVTIAGNKVEAGSYSIFMTPTAETWTVVLNSKSELSGTSGYDAANNVATFSVNPQACEMRERLSFQIVNFSAENAEIWMEWEKVRIVIPVQLATHEQAMANVKKILDFPWIANRNAARYLLENKKDMNEALGYINKSIELKNDQWYSYWLKAQIQKARGDNKDAKAQAVKAKELGDKNPEGFWYKADVEKAIKEW